MYVANVGDSRAVLAEVKAGKLVARDLTWDQTPFRQGFPSLRALIVSALLASLSSTQYLSPNVMTASHTQTCPRHVLPTDAGCAETEGDAHRQGVAKCFSPTLM